MRTRSCAHAENERPSTRGSPASRCFPFDHPPSIEMVGEPESLLKGTQGGAGPKAIFT